MWIPLILLSIQQSCWILSRCGGHYRFCAKIQRYSISVTKKHKVKVDTQQPKWFNNLQVVWELIAASPTKGHSRWHPLAQFIAHSFTMYKNICVTFSKTISCRWTILIQSPNLILTYISNEVINYKTIQKFIQTFYKNQNWFSKISIYFLLYIK